MKIPIDRYRLLGVAINAESSVVLNQLERRLDKCDYTGFSGDIQAKRANILREDADILLNTDKRKAYEDKYVSTERFENDNSIIWYKRKYTLDFSFYANKYRYGNIFYHL